MRTKKLWMIAPQESGFADDICREIGISPPIAQVLWNRGFRDIAAVREFFSSSLELLHSPFLMKDMAEGIERIVAGIERGEKIAVYGDYDVDGITSTALLVNFFHRLGVGIDFYIPNRMTEGYGLNREAIFGLKKQGVELIITVDCGISAVDEVELGNNLGLEFIITDHHQPGRILPKAKAVINPNRKDCMYPFKHLCGVGVAFKLIQALKESYSKASEVNIFELLDIVALGTVADVVPLQGENRVLVKNGLEVMRQAPNLGISHLCKAAGINRESISAEHLGYWLGPRLNASGRIEHAGVAVELLTTEDPQKAKDISLQLNDANSRRQNIEGEILQEALKLIEELKLTDDLVLVLGKEGWHPGVLGIVASKVTEKYHRPSVLLAIEGGMGKGSARSIEGFHLFEALTRCSAILEGFGGHAQAAGLEIKQENIVVLREKLNNLAKAQLRTEDLIPKLKIDCVLGEDDINDELIHQFGRLEPFGYGNPQPIFVLPKVPVASYRIVGNGKNHLKCSVGSIKMLSCIGFNLAETWEGIDNKEEVAIAFVPEFNMWNGNRSLQLRIIDVKEPLPKKGEMFLSKINLDSGVDEKVFTKLRVGDPLTAVYGEENALEIYWGEIRIGFVDLENIKKLGRESNYLLEMYSNLAWVNLRDFSANVIFYPKNWGIVRKNPLANRDGKRLTKNNLIFYEELQSELRKGKDFKRNRKRVLLFVRDIREGEEILRELQKDYGDHSVFFLHEGISLAIKADFLVLCGLGMLEYIVSTTDFFDFFWHSPFIDENTLCFLPETCKEKVSSCCW